MVARITIGELGQTGRTTTSWPGPIQQYRPVKTPPITGDVFAEAETKAIEADPDLLRRVLQRLNAPSFVPAEDVLTTGD